jgi:septal ring factor EnvC (AmiA/AmiB activator)
VEQRELTKQRDKPLAQGQQPADELSQQIAEVTARASKAEQDLNDLFDRQDQIAAATPQLQQKIDSIEQAIAATSQELMNLQQQMADEQADVYVKVLGTLYPMTTITTAHTSVKTRQPMTKIVIREKSKRDAGGDKVWRIVTESLK